MLILESQFPTFPSFFISDDCMQLDLVEESDCGKDGDGGDWVEREDKGVLREKKRRWSV